MTIIKQTGVQSNGHMKNLRGYINDDRKVLVRDSLNMDGCTNPKRWSHHMWMTREMYGHNKSARRVRDKKTGELKDAKNTVLFHQILGFNPDECDLNGGRLSPEDCMRYAKEYVGKYYPNQQIVMALHNEYCKADKTHRYAIHIVINRTDLSTGKRLDEGRGKSAKVKRASRIRDLDHEWGLKQVVEGERNSSVHKKQPSRIEKELAARGIDSYKTNLRELCRIAAGEAENIYDYRELLESWGVDTEFKRGRMYVTDTDNNRYAFSVAKLDADLGTKGLEAAFTANVAKSIHAEGSAAVAEKRDIEQQKAMVTETKERYLAQIRSVYRKYRKEIRGMEGMEIVDIPKLKPASRFGYRGRFGGQAPDSRLLARSRRTQGGSILDGHAEREEERRKRRKRRFPAGATGTYAGTPGTEQGERRALIKKRRGRDIPPAPLYGCVRIGIKAPAVPLMSHIGEQRAKARKFLHEGRKRVQFTSLCVRVKLTLEIRHLQPLEKEGNGRECSRDGKKKCRYEEQPESVTPHEQL